MASNIQLELSEKEEEKLYSRLSSHLKAYRGDEV